MGSCNAEMEEVTVTLAVGVSDCNTEDFGESDIDGVLVRNIFKL